LILVPLPLLAAGCLWAGTPSSGYGSGDASASAESEVRAAIPAIEAWNADHGTYKGVTLRGLHSYDAGVTGVRIVRATRVSYCIESLGDGVTASKTGPGGDIVDRPCAR
jgi:hypothetical protein